MGLLCAAHWVAVSCAGCKRQEFVDVRSPNLGWALDEAYWLLVMNCGSLVAIVSPIAGLIRYQPGIRGYGQKGSHANIQDRDPDSI